MKEVWDGLPRHVRRLLGWPLAAVPLHYILGPHYRRVRAFAEKAQHWSWEKSRVYQGQALASIARLAYEKSGFYRRTFDSAQVEPRDLLDPHGLRALPTIDRETLRDHFEEMCVVPRTRRNVDLVRTGGSTGQPVSFYIGRNRSSIEYAYLTASWNRIGYAVGMPIAVLRGRPVKPNRKGLRHEYDPVLRHHYYGAFQMTEKNMGRYLDHIGHIGPCFLHVYPSSVLALARFLLRTGESAPDNIRGIISESEILYSPQRQLVERVFGCRCLSCYGQSEKLVLAVGCEKTDDYHVWPTYGYCELLDGSGNPVTTPGQRGEIVGTGFINRAMPFIRYRTGDYATYVGNRCDACGREHLILRDIRGHRTQEVLIAADGSEISWVSLNMHDDTFDHVNRFQFYQDTPGRAVLRIVPGKGLGGSQIRRIKDRLDRKLEGAIAVEIEVADAIELTSRGKMVYVDQRIPRPGRYGQVAEDIQNG